MMLEVGLIIVGLTLFLWWALQPDAEIRRCGSKIPGPKSYPVVGNLFNIQLTGSEALKAQGELIEKHGRVIRLWMGNQLIVMLFDPQDIEVLLKSTTLIEKNKFYEFLDSWLGTGLLTGGGQKWRSRRKAITPTFHFKILDTFIDVFNRNGKILVQKLSHKVGQGAFDVHPFIVAYTLDIICETAMGTKIEAQEGNNKEYHDAVRDMSALLGRRFNTPILHSPLIWYLSGLKSKQDEYVNKLRHQTDQVIQMKKKELQGTAREKEAPQDLGIKQKTAFLEQLLEIKNQTDSVIQTDDDLQEEVNTFMFAGHDTTTSGISFSLNLLALHTQYQEKLYEELKSKFGDRDCNPTMKEINDLVYLDMVVKESLRFCPSVPTIGRQMTASLDLPSGYTIPKDSMALVSIYHTHRHNKWYQTPNEFNPDHFLPEVAAERHPFAFIPFSAGLRNCIGQKFALLEIKLTLIKLVMNFNISCDPDYTIQPDSNLVLQALRGHMIKLSKRHW